MATAKTRQRGKSLGRRCQRLWATMLANLKQGHLWQRMAKNAASTTIMLVIGLIPAVIDVFGRSTYLGAMVTVFGHPGQRFGQMTESLMLIFMGVVVGLGWSVLGLYLSSLAIADNVTAAYAIRAVFFTFALVFHGVMRSSTPRLFLFVFFFLLICLTVLTTTASSVSSNLVAQIAYPILTALGVVILVNVAIFPESSSGFLGNSVIETMHDTIRCLEDAGDWFMSDSQVTDAAESAKRGPEKTEQVKGLPVDLRRTKLVSLTDRKPKLRAKLAGSKKAQAECNFEVVFAVLPPRSLKPISTTFLSRLVQDTICLINACESKYALVGEGDNDATNQGIVGGDGLDETDSSSGSSATDSSSDESSRKSEKPKNVRRKSKHVRNLELIKPVREIESGDIQLLEHILSQVRIPAKVLQNQIHQALEVITSSLAYAYEVEKLPSGAKAPKGILVEEVDIRLDAFTEALTAFDMDSASALENAAAMVYGAGSQADIMPRVETFLISSFLISLRQAATQISDMLKYSRVLVETRQGHKRRRIYFPKISWKKWLKTGGEQDVNSVPENARKEARAGHGTREEKPGRDESDPSRSHDDLLRQPNDEETGKTPEELELPEKGKIPRRRGPQKSEGSTAIWLRGLAADVIEFVADSDDLAFALKMSIAGYIVTWPAFVPAFNPWYASIRGSWASLQLILVFEVSVGTSFMGFFLRVIGVIYGCVAGFLALEIGQGNRVVAVVVLLVAMIPATYVHLGTPYVKTGIISVVSMSVVGLASIVQPDADPWEIFVKRMICFLVGGTVALLVELTLFPVRARDRLVESLASGIQQISNMEASVAIGIDNPGNIDIKSHTINASFTNAKEKAEAALTAARTFLPFTLTEPRLKGSFKGQALIYNEIIYVLFQIIDRMDNVLHMRKAYGSSVLEEFNEKVLPYRRNVAASITLTLFAVHEALTTRLPLPQFLPSSRVAQLRYIRRVREVMLEQSDSTPGSSAASQFMGSDSRRGSTPLHVLRSFTRQNFLSWNAGSSGMMEIIEYLEELVDLAKLLVGVNAFRTGMLERPNFHEYILKMKLRQLNSSTTAEEEQEVERIMTDASANIRKRRGFSFRRASSPGAAIKKRQTFNGQTGADAAVDFDSDSDAPDELPMSLQRVRTRRMEEQRIERVRRESTADAKGKGVFRAAKTWGV